MSLSDKPPRTPLGTLAYVGAWIAVGGATLGFLRARYLRDRAQDTLQHPELSDLYRFEADGALYLTLVVGVVAAGLFVAADRMRR